ncbi:hypothetical protein [Pollutibacter soli]|uniref:hypothetical protein n=1 Tax=Pollutibacter soli TaxID=3034157 RepID=UPI0030132D4B
MNDIVVSLVSKARKIYPALSGYNADPDSGFIKVAKPTASRSAYSTIWPRIISQIRIEFPETHIEDRKIHDI